MEQQNQPMLTEHSHPTHTQLDEARAETSTVLLSTVSSVPSSVKKKAI